MAGNLWTETELAILRKAYPRGGVARALAAMRAAGFDRTRDSVRQKASELAIRHEPVATRVPSEAGSISVRLPKDIVARIDGAREHRTRSEYIRDVLREHA